MAVNGTTIQVQFDADAGDMSGNCVDIPYESPISNSFYCMPDVGDKVFVYYENNGKIICMGSRRSSTSSPDFDKPEEKVLTSYDKMLRMEGKKVILTDTRKKHDDGDDTEISITLNDEDGITITSGENIVIESTEKNIYLATGIEESDVTKDIEGLSNGKDKFRTWVAEENARYVAEGGMNDAEKLKAVHGAQIDNFCSQFQQSMQDTRDGLYEQMNPDGTVKSRAFYDENGNQFSRQDFDHRHFDKKTKQYYQPHEHNYSYNENGQPTGKSDGPLPKGYSNKPTN